MANEFALGRQYAEVHGNEKDPENVAAFSGHSRQRHRRQAGVSADAENAPGQVQRQFRKLKKFRRRADRVVLQREPTMSLHQTVGVRPVGLQYLAAVH